MKYIICLLVILSFVACSSEKIKIGQLNLEWYPYHSKENWEAKKVETDENLLYRTIIKNDFDIMSCNEVTESVRLKQLITGKSKGAYDYVFLPGSEAMNVGFVYKKDRVQLLTVERWNEIQLEPNFRPALHCYFKIIPGGFDFHHITLHMKSGGQSVEIRKKQWQAIIEKIKNLQSDDKDIIIQGDFNSYDEGSNMDFTPFDELITKYGFHHITKQQLGTYCEKGKPSSIDHMLVSDSVFTKNLIPPITIGMECPLATNKNCDGFETSEWATKLSDHCLIWTNYDGSDYD